MILLLTILFAALATSAVQAPDSTVMNLTVGPGDGVPTTTIIPVAEPPIQEVDTTYIRVSPPDTTQHKTKKRHHKHHCTKTSPLDQPQQIRPKNRQR